MLRALLMASLLMVPMAAADWSQFQADSQNRGWVDDDTFAPFEELWWAVRSQGDEQGDASPVTNGEYVIWGDWGGNLYALDAQSGDTVWTYKMNTKITSTPAISGNRVYAADESGLLVSLSLSTGKVLATADVGATKGTLTIFEGKLFIGNEAGAVLAYDTQTLTRLWAYNTAIGKTGDCGKTKLIPGGQVRAAPLVHDGVVFFGALNNHFYAVKEQGNPDKSTDPVWVFEADDIIWSSATVVKGDVVVGSYDEHLYAFDDPSSAAEANGAGCGYHPRNDSANATLAEIDLGTSKIHSSPAVDIETGDLFFGTNSGNIYSYRYTGSSFVENWRHDAGDLVVSSPAIANGIVVVGTDAGEILWLDAEGDRSAKTTTVLASFDAGASIKSSPAISDGRAIVASFDGVLRSLGPEVPGGPDLVIDAIDVAVTKHLLHVNVTVSNEGTRNAGASTLHLEVAGTTEQDLAVEALKAGESTTVGATFASSLFTGFSIVRATADSGDVLDEENEQNNAEEKQVDLTPPASRAVNDEPTALEKLTPGPAPILVLFGLALVALRRR